MTGAGVGRFKADLPDLTELLLNFESLGDNCEFGVFQRQAGIEVLGLLRFSFSPLASLLHGFSCQFSDLPDLEKITIHVADNSELIVRIAEYKFHYHSGRRAGEITPDELRQDEKIKLTFLIRRLFKTVLTGEKIFVRKGRDTATLDEAQNLLFALRAHGPATLLWVIEADSQHPAGSVQLVAPHLICGRIGSFAPYTDAMSIDITCWVNICRGALALWQADWGVGTFLYPHVEDEPAGNLLYRLQNESMIGGLPRIMLQQAGSTTDSNSGEFPARDPAGPTVSRHILATDGNGMAGARVSGLEPDVIHSFSAWIRLDNGNKISAVSLGLPLAKHVRSRRIDIGLRDRWQRLEVSAIVPKNGIMFPRIQFKGATGAGLESANWRLERGLTVGSDERPA